MIVENQSLRRIAGSVELIGKVAITTQKTEALRSPNRWTGETTIPTGTAVLVIEQSGVGFVKVIWNEKTVFINTEDLRLVQINNAFDGKSFVITGELTAPREYFKNLIKLKGGNFKSAVSKNCDYLIVGSPTRSAKSSKLKKAMKLGISIITEQQFFDLIAEE